MDVTRGMLRLWIVFASLWVIFSAWTEEENLHFGAVASEFPRYISETMLAFWQPASRKARASGPITKDSCISTPAQEWDEMQNLCIVTPGSELDNRLEKEFEQQATEDAQRAEISTASNATVRAVVYISGPPICALIISGLALWIFRGFYPHPGRKQRFPR